MPLEILLNLCTHYDVILIPEFNVQLMVTKRAKNGSWARKISKNTSRLMMRHYQFRQRLIQKAREAGKVLLVVDEAYTSKTCSQCGHQNNSLGSSKVFRCPCGSVMDRDANAAKNILLRNICS